MSAREDEVFVVKKEMYGVSAREDEVFVVKKEM